MWGFCTYEMQQLSIVHREQLYLTHEEVWIVERSSAVEMCCQREWILGFLPSSLSAGCCSTQMLQLSLAVHPYPPPLSAALTSSKTQVSGRPAELWLPLVERLSHDNRLTLNRTCWGWWGKACLCGCLSRSSRCAHHSLLCRCQCCRLFYDCLQECTMTLYNSAITALKYSTISGCIASEHQ